MIQFFLAHRRTGQSEVVQEVLADLKRDKLNSVKYFTQDTDICRTQLSSSSPRVTSVRSQQSQLLTREDKVMIGLVSDEKVKSSV